MELTKYKVPTIVKGDLVYIEKERTTSRIKKSRLAKIALSYFVILPLLLVSVYGSKVSLYWNSYKEKTLFAGDCVPLIFSRMNKKGFDYAGRLEAREKKTYISLQSRRYLPYKNVVFIPSTLKRYNKEGDDKYIEEHKLKLAKMFPFSRIIIPSNELLSKALEMYEHPMFNQHLSEEGHIWMTTQEPFKNSGILEDILEGKK